MSRRNALMSASFALLILLAIVSLVSLRSLSVETASLPEPNPQDELVILEKAVRYANDQGYIDANAVISDFVIGEYLLRYEFTEAFWEQTVTTDLSSELELVDGKYHAGVLDAITQEPVFSVSAVRREPLNITSSWSVSVGSPKEALLLAQASPLDRVAQVPGGTYLVSGEDATPLKTHYNVLTSTGSLRDLQIGWQKVPSGIDVPRVSDGRRRNRSGLNYDASNEYTDSFSNCPYLDTYLAGISVITILPTWAGSSLLEERI